MHLNGGEIGSVDLSGSKNCPCNAIKTMVKAKGNILGDGYSNSSVATIGNDIYANNSVAIITNIHVEVPLN